MLASNSAGKGATSASAGDRAASCGTASGWTATPSPLSPQPSGRMSLALSRGVGGCGAACGSVVITYSARAMVAGVAVVVPATGAQSSAATTLAATAPVATRAAHTTRTTCAAHTTITRAVYAARCMAPTATTTTAPTITSPTTCTATVATARATACVAADGSRRPCDVAPAADTLHRVLLHKQHRQPAPAGSPPVWPQSLCTSYYCVDPQARPRVPTGGWSA